MAGLTQERFGSGRRFSAFTGWMVLLALAGGCATAPAPQPAPAAAAQQPAQAVAWRYVRTNSYEGRFPGLGVSHRHESGAGWVDVYEYDLRRNDWADGVADAQFAAHFDSTVEEVRMLGRRGTYAGVQIGATRDVTIAEMVFRSVDFHYTRDGRVLHSATYLTARYGKLLKYRISLNAGAGLDMDAVARRFIEDNLQTGVPRTRA